MREITLTQGFVTLVDDGDYEWLSKHKWYISHGYADRDEFTNRKRRHISMHRVIMNAQRGEDVDHINHNGLDNRRQNLRVCTHTENLRNAKVQTGKTKTSKYKGVSWDSRRYRWRSYIVINYHQIHLGRFTKEEDAAKVYNNAAIEYFGEFASINSIRE